MKRTAVELSRGARVGLGAGLLISGLALGCGEAKVEAKGERSGFTRLGPPTPEVSDPGTGGVAPAPAPDRPVVPGSGADRPEGFAGAPAGPDEVRPASGGPPRTDPREVERPGGLAGEGAAGTSGAAASGALVTGASLAERESSVRALLAEGREAEAAQAVSGWLLSSLVDGGTGEDPGAITRYVELVREVQARHRWRAQGDWPAVEISVQPGEGLIALRKRTLSQHPGLLICTGLIARANQLTHPETLQPGDVLRIPVDQARVVVDLSARWAFYCFGDEVADAWPVGIGKPGQETPPGEYTVGIKQERPPWHPRGRPMVPYGDPENPLGSHWVGWIDENGRPTDVGFHGTSDESGVGGEVSLGCVRMRNPDVGSLHDILPQGAAVRVQP